MGKVKELFREQQEVDMFNSLECREAYIRGYEKGYDDGWYDQEQTESFRYPACMNCKYHQFGEYCSLLDIQTAYIQTCDGWELEVPANYIYSKNQMKYISLVKAGIIKADK